MNRPFLFAGDLVAKPGKHPFSGMDTIKNARMHLLNNRNINLANRSIPLIKKASTFIAIGAAHLPGEDGVIEILRKKGYTVIAR